MILPSHNHSTCLTLLHLCTNAHRVRLEGTLDTGVNLHFTTSSLVVDVKRVHHYFSIDKILAKRDIIILTI